MSRPIHFIDVSRPSRQLTATCGVEADDDSFFSSTTAKLAVTCLDCQASPAYARSIQRLSLVPGVPRRG